MSAPLKIAVVAGEESGDQLGADIIAALKRKTQRSVSLIGVGGNHLEALGLKSQFNADEIALMGIGEVFKKIPRLMRRIRTLARFISHENPDCLILVDSPDFTHRVAQKVRKQNPNILIIKYIAPTVWAWRPERAKQMAAYIDHVLVVLPFEEKVMRDLAGPGSSYVGHRLLSYPPLVKVKNARARFAAGESADAPVLVVLPGSRRSEIHYLMPVFGQTIACLKERVPNLKVVLPTLQRLEDEVRKMARDWSFSYDIVVGEETKWCAFQTADVALAASGTVSLELALCKIPTVLSYKTDLFTKMFIQPRIKVWSAALPNIIADEPIVPEFFNEFAKPQVLAREVEYLLTSEHARQAQLDGFSKVERLMAVKQPSGAIGAAKILQLLQNKAVL